MLRRGLSRSGVGVTPPCRVGGTAFALHVTRDKPRRWGDRRSGLYPGENVIMVYIVMWLLGVPLGLIVLLWLLGVFS